MADQELARQKIKALVDKYDRLKKEGRLSRYNEENTKAEFIEPLFEALGWDVRNTYHPDEVTREEKISKDRVDYSFRINGIPKFFLEAKALRENLDNQKFVEQSINYSWHKGCTWAVLTDFESVKIFNAEWRASDYTQSHLKTIACYEFLQRFDELWLLSKESFQQGLLDKEAEKWGKKTKKTPVDKQLLADFTRFRETLSKNITKLNQSKNLSQEELDEATQRILDRLIFIRYCEDKGLEEKKLISNLREWGSRGKGQLVRSIREVYAYFDRLYNSKIFSKHLCDELEIDNEVLHEIIEGLHYTKDRSIAYDFSAIEADVLGNIYEQYLGHILKKTTKTAKLTESQAHRKEQGIYYTPTYIVDYIVKNTLGKMLEDKKVNPDRIRILDMACGSGSFLIKTFDILNEYYIKHDKDYIQTTLDASVENGIYSKKLKMLQNNIFGVDLDRQAVEVAQLNLLLKVAEKGQRLPLLQQNIKQGNSLIDSSFSPEDRAFKWKDEFPQITQEGGFDVIIGNPPYVRQETISQHKEYLSMNYKVYHPAADLYTYFIERGVSLLREGGYMGIIVSNKWLRATYGEKLRRWLKQLQISEIIDFGDLPVFEDATTYPCILILRKAPAKKTFDVTRVQSLNFDTLNSYVSKQKYSINQENLQDSGWSLAGRDKGGIIDKIRQTGIPLGEYVQERIYRGILTGLNEAFVIDRETRDKLVAKDRKSAELLKPFAAGRDIKRYLPLDPNKYLISIPYGWTRKQIADQKDAWGWFERSYPAIAAHLKPFEKDAIKRYDKGEYWWELRSCAYYSEFEKPKIMLPDISLRGNFTLDKKGQFYCVNTAYIISSSDLYLLGILNSKLITFFYQNISSTIRGGYLRFIFQYLVQLPIFPKEKAPSTTNIMERLVASMLSLNEKLSMMGDKKTDERARIVEEIKKVDAEIDELVYKLYGITEEEKKIIEESIR